MSLDESYDFVNQPARTFLLQRDDAFTKCRARNIQSPSCLRQITVSLVNSSRYSFKLFVIDIDSRVFLRLMQLSFLET